VAPKKTTPAEPAGIYKVNSVRPIIKVLKTLIPASKAHFGNLDQFWEMQNDLMKSNGQKR
jgi:hypothetical protein